MSHGPRVGQLASLIEAAQRRLQDITNRAAAAGVGGGFLQEALGELTQVLKELQAAGEGLIEGNDALVAACRAVEAVEAGGRTAISLAGAGGLSGHHVASFARPTARRARS